MIDRNTSTLELAMKYARPQLTLEAMHAMIAKTTGRTLSGATMLCKSVNPTFETMVSISHSLDVSPELLMHLLYGLVCKDTARAPRNFLVPKCKGVARRVSAERMKQHYKAEAKRVLARVASEL